MAGSSTQCAPAAETDLESGQQRLAKLSDLSDFMVSSPLVRGAAGSVSHGSPLRPCLFERAARSWWDPRFDSDILEGQYRKTTFPRIKRRLQIGLVFVLLAAVMWCVYVGIHRDLVLLGILCVVGVVPLLALLAISETSYLEKHPQGVSAVLAISLCLLSLLPAMARLQFFPGGQSVTELHLFTWAIVTITLIYTMIPLPLYASVLASLLYSVALEALEAVDSEASGRRLAVRAGLHLCLHLIGLRILVLAQVHMRSTFTTVGQTLLTRRQLELEKQLKEKMIHSVMPPALADWVQDELRDETDAFVESTSLGADLSSCAAVPLSRPPRQSPAGPEISFRPFNMRPMDKVSILFADIVGFTRMSSNKTAEQLVGLLNGLFGKFDELCARHGCEKISTLGDCYYCVSGCPEPRADHAHCCVEMGLAMIVAIQQFDQEKNEQVNMRVGVHTGRVLYGLVGTKRFKFDVWSNDVTMANKMESSGKPGKVHISEKTYTYLDGQYLVTPGEPLGDLQTYFIVGRKDMFGLHSEPSSPPETSGLPPGGPLAKKATSLPSIIEPIDSRQPEPARQTLTLDRRRSPTKPRLRPTRTELDLKARRGEVRTRLVSGGASLQPLPEELPPAEPAQDDNAFYGDDDDEDDEEGVEDQLLGVSMSSFNSRKDSGIRSRRSSIQAQVNKNNVLSVKQNPVHSVYDSKQIAVLNGMKPGDLLTHRVSGYYTSSQSSLNDPANIDLAQLALEEAEAEADLAGQDPTQLLRQQLIRRKVSDLQMIRCVQQMSSHSNYFINPPVDRVTLFYKNRDFERQYRHQHARRHHAAVNTLSLPKYNILVDTLTATLVFLVVGAALYATYRPTLAWLVYSGLVIVWLALVQCLMWFRLTSGVSRRHNQRFAVIYTWYTRWYPFHVAGATVISLPVGAVFTNWTCDNFSDSGGMELYFFMFFVGLVHYCNFTQLNCWVKSLLATISAVVMSVLVYLRRYECVEAVPDSVSGRDVVQKTANACHQISLADVAPAMAVLVTLVIILNREFEISYRLGFCVNLMAARDKFQVQKLKNQADWLLHNIIPKHVAEVIKTKAKYSENHYDVGVVFASIINFNDLYDETYHGGKEYLRVLNEIIGDIDDILSKYPSVEKIKTIGSTYMAASGLNPLQRRCSDAPDQHLIELMDFAMDMQKAVDAFNVSLFEFELELRIGYNFGDVTAGVIGTTKLYYDIWGDTVNTASRMDSTGVPKRIQTTQKCAEKLSPYFDFELRGEVYVKGKDNMVTYFLKGRKEGGSVS